MEDDEEAVEQEYENVVDTDAVNDRLGAIRKHLKCLLCQEV